MHLVAVPALAHAPPQLLNVPPEAAVAISVTVLPSGNPVEQVVPQSIPAGLDVTLPLPLTLTLSTETGGPVVAGGVLPPPPPQPSNARPDRLVKHNPHSRRNDGNRCKKSAGLDRAMGSLRAGNREQKIENPESIPVNPSQSIPHDKDDVYRSFRFTRASKMFRPVSTPRKYPSIIPIRCGHMDTDFLTPLIRSLILPSTSVVDWRVLFELIGLDISDPS